MTDCINEFWLLMESGKAILLQPLLFSSFSALFSKISHLSSRKEQQSNSISTTPHCQEERLAHISVLCYAFGQQRLEMSKRFWEGFCKLLKFEFKILSYKPYEYQLKSLQILDKSFLLCLKYIPKIIAPVSPLLCLTTPVFC